MDMLRWFVDFFLHLDVHLGDLIRQYGSTTYAILFAIIFVETGLVVMPFLPGDSLLFAAGAFAALGSLDPWLLFGLLSVAAILGDTVNYWIGAKAGPKAFSGNIRFLKVEYLDRTKEFYERHGSKTIVLARFIPIVRTFAPFVAGIGGMRYRTFITYNVVGAVLWVGLGVWTGYFFGNIPVVRDNFTIVIFVIIGISVLPIAFEAIKARKARGARAGQPG
ncbi:MAG: DedA family protein [Gemmatimonadales bacterium]